MTKTTTRIGATPADPSDDVDLDEVYRDDSEDWRQDVLKRLGRQRHKYLLRDLSAEQRTKLLDTLVECSEEFERMHDPHAMKLRAVARRQSPGKVRKIQRLFERALLHLRRLQKVVNEVGAPRAKRNRANPYLAHLLQLHFQSSIADALAQLVTIGPPPSWKFRSGRNSGDLRHGFCALLYRYYTDTCGVGKQSAYSRVAIISRRLWHDRVTNKEMQQRIERLSAAPRS